jgi:hypothetical protein
LYAGLDIDWVLLTVGASLSGVDIMHQSGAERGKRRGRCALSQEYRSVTGLDSSHVSNSMRCRASRNDDDEETSTVSIAEPHGKQGEVDTVEEK